MLLKWPSLIVKNGKMIKFGSFIGCWLKKQVLWCSMNFLTFISEIWYILNIKEFKKDHLISILHKKLKHNVKILYNSTNSNNNTTTTTKVLKIKEELWRAQQQNLILHKAYSEGVFLLNLYDSQIDLQGG